MGATSTTAGAADEPAEKRRRTLTVANDVTATTDGTADTGGPDPDGSVVSPLSTASPAVAGAVVGGVGGAETEVVAVAAASATAQPEAEAPVEHSHASVTRSLIVQAHLKWDRLRDRDAVQPLARPRHGTSRSGRPVTKAALTH
jgi:hypothetical protein